MFSTDRRRVVTAFTALAFGSAACGSLASDDGGEASIPDDTVIDRYGEITRTVGPNGESPTPSSDISLTKSDVGRLRSGEHRVAILWHELSGWSQAIQDGMEDEFRRLGISIVATADARFDPATQANQIESALAKDPEVILGQAVDPATAAAAYRPAVDKGVELIFADQAPEGYSYGKEYQAVLTDSLYQVGLHAGRALCEAIDGTGEVAIMYYDADFHVTNFRDAAFQQTLHDECPDAEIVAKEGFSDPNKAEEIAGTIVARHPDLAGFYVSWAVPAQGVLAALNSAGNTSTRIVTIDLDDTIATDMASPTGHTAAIVVDEAYAYGRAMARAAGLAILGKRAPEYAVSGVVTATEDNVAEGYEAWNQSVPQQVLEADN